MSKMLKCPAILSNNKDIQDKQNQEDLAQGKSSKRNKTKDTLRFVKLRELPGRICKEPHTPACFSVKLRHQPGATVKCSVLVEHRTSPHQQDTLELVELVLQYMSLSRKSSLTFTSNRDQSTQDVVLLNRFSE